MRSSWCTICAVGHRAKPEKYRRFTVALAADAYASRMQNACYGMSAERIAALCQVDVATARRWKSGRSRIPYVASLVLAGDLGVFGKDWSGWCIEGGNIRSPDGWVIDRNHALSVPLMEAQLRQRDAAIEALKAEIEHLKTVQSLPDQPEHGLELGQIKA